MAETTMEPWSFAIVFDEDKAKKNGYEVDTLYDYVGKNVEGLGRTSRPKVREYLRTPCVKLPDGAAALLLAEAKSWCGAVVGSMEQCVTTGAE